MLTCACKLHNIEDEFHFSIVVHHMLVLELHFITIFYDLYVQLVEIFLLLLVFLLNLILLYHLF